MHDRNMSEPKAVPCIKIDEDSDDELLLVKPMQSQIGSSEAKERERLLEQSRYVHAHDLSHKIPETMKKYLFFPGVCVGISGSWYVNCDYKK